MGRRLWVMSGCGGNTSTCIFFFFCVALAPESKAKSFHSKGIYDRFNHCHVLSIIDTSVLLLNSLPSTTIIIW